MQTDRCQHAESEIKIKWMCYESIICVESEKLHLYFVTSYQQFSIKSECYKSWQTMSQKQWLKRSIQKPLNHEFNVVCKVINWNHIKISNLTEER